MKMERFEYELEEEMILSSLTPLHNWIVGP